MSPETCFKRWLIAQACSGSSATILRRRRSSVPWTRSAGLLMDLPSVTEDRMPYLPSVSKGRWSEMVEVGQMTNQDVEPLPSSCRPRYGATPVILAASQLPIVVEYSGTRRRRRPLFDHNVGRAQFATLVRNADGRVSCWRLLRYQQVNLPDAKCARCEAAEQYLSR